MRSSTPTSRTVESRLAFVHRHTVVSDSDLADLFGVPLKTIRDLVARHPENFPGELCFQPDTCDVALEYRPVPRNVFTERGAWMIAALLGSAPILTLELSRAFDRYSRAVGRAGGAATRSRTGAYDSMTCGAGFA
jgi:hypothetical protein